LPPRSRSGSSRRSRAHLGSPDARRYVYAGAFLVVLGAIELVRGVRLGRRGLLILAVAVALAALGNTLHLTEGRTSLLNY
jgi:hypothetical protein